MLQGYSIFWNFNGRIVLYVVGLFPDAIQVAENVKFR
jgi:hypothetical protein